MLGHTDPDVMAVGVRRDGLAAAKVQATMAEADRLELAELRRTRAAEQALTRFDRDRVDLQVLFSGRGLSLLPSSVCAEVCACV